MLLQVLGGRSGGAGETVEGQVESTLCEKREEKPRYMGQYVGGSWFPYLTYVLSVCLSVTDTERMGPCLRSMAIERPGNRN